MRKQSNFTGCALVFLGFALILFTVAVAYEGSDPCNPIDTWRNIRELERYANHLVAVEDAAEDGQRPSSSSLAQIDGDMQTLSYAEYNVCVEPAADSLECALLYASNYYGDYPYKDASARSNYEACLRTYYHEIETLRACWPLCILTQP